MNDDDDMIGDMQEPFTPPNIFKAPPPVVRINAIVRDKHGRPKFDDPAKIKHFLEADRLRAERGLPPRLTEEDLTYLKEVHGDDFCNY